MPDCWQEIPVFEVEKDRRQDPQKLLKLDRLHVGIGNTAAQHRRRISVSAVREISSNDAGGAACCIDCPLMQRVLPYLKPQIGSETTTATLLTMLPMDATSDSDIQISLMMV